MYEFVTIAYGRGASYAMLIDTNGKVRKMTILDSLVYLMELQDNGWEVCNRETRKITLKKWR